MKHHVPRLGITLPLNEMPRDRNRGSTTIESFDWGIIDRPDEEFTGRGIYRYALPQLLDHIIGAERIGKFLVR